MKVGALTHVNSAPLHLRRSYVIGCGGMGGEVLRHFKKILSEKFETRDFKAIQLLSLDSALPDLEDGTDNLQEFENLRIPAANISEVVGNLGDHPNIERWFPKCDAKTLEKILAETSSMWAGAGSTRPFGRVGFFEHWERVYEQLRGMAQAAIGPVHTRDGAAVRVEAEDSQHFYLVTSVGGGTGTGIFFDLAGVVRKLQRDLGGRNWEVHLVLVLPETLVRDSKIPRKYSPQIMANSYAALKELDYFLHGNPYEARYGRGQGDVVSLSNQNPDDSLFTRVYLVDAENAKGKSCATRDELARLIGETLFHLAATESGRDLERRLPDMRARLFFQEERPEPSPEDQLLEITRERRRCLYSSFGVSTLQIPIAQILDYCAAQRAVEAFSFATTGSSEDPEQVERRVVELMNGTPTEVPILDRLGISSMRLDQLLDLSHTLPPLPEAQVIVDAPSPAAALLATFSENRWASLREALWEKVSRKCDDIRHKLIDGIMEPVKGGPSRPVAGALSTLVSELLAREGPQVVDVLLDRMESELQTIKQDAEATLSGLRQALEADIDDGAKSKEWRQLEEHRSAIEVLESRSPVLRGWLNRRRLGPAIEDALSALQRLRKRFSRLPALAEKLRLCDALISEVNRQDDSVLPALAKGLLTIKRELQARREHARAACAKQRAPTLRPVVLRLNEFYERIYLPALGPAEASAQLARRLERDGITLTSGSVLMEPDWGSSPQEVCDELQRIVRAPLYREDSADLPGPSTRGPEALWRFDFDSSFFTDLGDAADDFDALTREIVSHSDVFLEYERNSTPSLPWVRLISGSCRGELGRRWTSWINVDGLAGQASPGMPNQVTLLQVRLAFPLFSLKRIQVWKRHYDDYRRRGWPVHVFKEASHWPEPYIAPVERDQAIKEADLFNEAVSRGVIKPMSGDASRFVFPSPRSEIRVIFEDERGRERGLTPQEFQRAMIENRTLVTGLLDDVLEQIIKHEGRDLIAKVKQGAYPAFLQRELTGYLRDRGVSP